jgi:hypothetical protein
MVSEQRYDQGKVNKYREAATELHELSTRVEQRIESAFESGIDQAVHDALAELKASGAEFQKLRSTLTQTELFIAKYNIQVHGAHKVSFVLPKGVSRNEMLCEAQEVVTERALVWPFQLKEWSSDPRFRASTAAPERIQIDGHVKGGDGKTRAQQEAFLRRKKLPLANLEDLAAAFVAHCIATGEPLFGWYRKSDGRSFVVRAAGGVLGFNSDGLCVYDIVVSDGCSERNVAVSACVPRN